MFMIGEGSRSGEALESFCKNPMWCFPWAFRKISKIRPADNLPNPVQKGPSWGVETPDTADEVDAGDGVAGLLRRNC